MWTRVELKEAAKSFLRNHYWVAFGVSLIASILASTGQKIQWRSEGPHHMMNPVDFGHFEDWMGFDWHHGARYWLTGTMFLWILAIIIAGILFYLFISNIIVVGAAKFYLMGNQESVNWKNIFWGFQSPAYKNMVKAMFITDLKIFLWSLLFIIPGIIKWFEYRMVPYLLAENPELTYEEAQSQSRALTYGHKGDIFVLHISFIGWYILGSLLFGIGVFFVNPYYDATFMHLYLKLKEINPYYVEGRLGRN